MVIYIRIKIFFQFLLFNLNFIKNKALKNNKLILKIIY